MNMKKGFFNNIWQPVRRWVDKITGRKNDDDPFGNHFAVL
jgi:hypothetical protein